MRTTSLAYAAAAAATTAGTLLRDDRVHAAAKYAIAPLAALDALTQPGAWHGARAQRSIVLATALAGSALGDHFMLTESRASDRVAASAALRRGAGAFAVQQLGFVALMARRGQRLRRGSLTAGAAALTALAIIDAVVAQRHSASIETPDSPLPDPVVAGYGVLLTAMAALAQDDARTRWGGRVFLASDAIIVTRQLLPHGPARRVADAAVMASYTVALKLLVDGLVS